MMSLILGFVVSAVLTLMLVRSARTHGHLSADSDTSGPQKFHARPVPRIGGIGIYASVAVAGLATAFRSPSLGEFGLVLLLCGLPAFGMGLLEDFTKKVSPRWRLLATAASAASAVFVLGAVLERTAIPGLDAIVSRPLGAAAVTVFVVAGVANSFNIVDGFNGLSSMCVTIILVSLAYVAHQVGDTLLAYWALAGVGAVLGFFVWNFPGGLIFLGDGGAYFSGFYVAEMAILLLHRNPQVSPMFPLLVCIYPVFETLFSIYRRRLLRDVSPGLPDGIHLHSLIYRRLVRWAAGNRSARVLTRRNSMTSPYLWMLCIVSVVPGVTFWDNTPALAGCIIAFCAVYVTLYWRIVRFKAPRWLVFRR